MSNELDDYEPGEDITAPDEHARAKRIRVTVSFDLEESQLLSRLEEARGLNAVQLMRALVLEAAERLPAAATRKG
jgi:hypothetical protein